MTFSSATAVAPLPDGRFDVTVDPVWSVGGKAHGGFLIALMARAAVAVSPPQHPHVLAASAHYLHSPDAGPADLETEVLRAGRSASQVRVRLRQAGRACIEALFMVGVLDPAATPYWTGGVPDPGEGDRSAAIRTTTPTPAGFALPFLDVVDLRLDPESAGFAVRRPRGLGELRGWLEMSEDLDPVSLLFALDAFPPATFDVEMTGWVPTLELTAYIRALPAPGPVRVLHQARLIDGQRVDEACFIWDSTGRLVAQSTQLAGIRLG